MKIYNEIVFDVDGNVTYEDSYEYSEGNLMLCQPNIPDMNNDGGVNVVDYKLYAAQLKSEGKSQDEILAIMTGSTATTMHAEGMKKQASDLGMTVPEYESFRQEQRGKEQLAAQIQASDIQINPLPSLSAVSSVGSTAPTGVINWNAIPGGFQPLPQVAGGRKKLYQLSQFHGGVNQKSSPRDIADFECQEAQNVTVSQVGRIKLLGDCLNENN